MTIDPKAPLTPNIKALLVEFMSVVAVEQAKSEYGTADAGAVAMQLMRLPEHARIAKQRLEQAITAMESAPDIRQVVPSASPEEIAGYILTRLKERNR